MTTMSSQSDDVKSSAKGGVGSASADMELETEGDTEGRSGEAPEGLSHAKDVEEVITNADGTVASEEGPLKRLADAPGNEMEG